MRAWSGSPGKMGTRKIPIWRGPPSRESSRSLGQGIPNEGERVKDPLDLGPGAVRGSPHREQEALPIRPKRTAQKDPPEPCAGAAPQIAAVGSSGESGEARAGRRG